MQFSHLFLVLTSDGEDGSVQPADLFMSVKLQMASTQTGSDTACSYCHVCSTKTLAGWVCVGCVTSPPPGGAVEETTLRNSHYCGPCWNITHLPTLPPSDGRRTGRHQSRASRRPIDGLPKRPTPCLSSPSRRLHPTCQFLQIHTTRPRKNEAEPLQEAPEEGLTWSVCRLLTGYYTPKKSIRV